MFYANNQHFNKPFKPDLLKCNQIHNLVLLVHEMEEVNEYELLKRMKENPKGFSDLFNQHYKSIFGYILRRTGDFDIASDISAETFLKAFLNIHRFNYRGVPIKAWLYRIATNELNQFFRYEKKQSQLYKNLTHEKKYLFESYLVDDKNDVELELKKHDQFLKTLVHLKELPIKYQEVISLKYFEGKSNSEILEILDIPMGTLKSLLSRGIKKLKNKISPE